MDNFDLKKYLIENKVTTNSKIMKENVEKPSRVSDETWLQIDGGYAGHHSENIVYKVTKFTGNRADMEALVKSMIDAKEISKDTNLTFVDSRVVAFHDYDGNFVFFVKEGAFPGPVDGDFIDTVEEYTYEKGDDID